MSERTDPPLLVATGLTREYPVRGTHQTLTAVADVSLTLGRGETLGVVGESGCGKSTLARLLVRLEDPTAGRIELDGRDVTSLRHRALGEFRRRVQLVFQDPYASLNPRITVGATLDEVLTVHRRALLGTAQTRALLGTAQTRALLGTAQTRALLGNARTRGSRDERRRRVGDLLELVGLPARFASRYPHQLSGGQRQRVGIARALAVEPDVIVLDEPLSALDVSVQSGIMNLLTDLRDELGVAYVFISHDLGAVRHLADRIAVMYLGRVVELGPWAPVSDEPLHPYTKALQDAVPVADPAVEASRHVEALAGEVPDPADPPPGCPFHPRCPLAEDVCGQVRPELVDVRGSHEVACHVAIRAAGTSELGLAERRQ